MKYKGLVVAIIGPGTEMTHELARLLAEEHSCQVLIALDKAPNKFSDEAMDSLKSLHKLTTNRPFEINPIIIRDEQPNKYFHKPRNNFRKR